MNENNLSKQEQIMIDAYRSGAAIEIAFYGHSLMEHEALDWAKRLNEDVKTEVGEDMTWYNARDNNVRIDVFHENSLLNKGDEPK